MTRYLLAALILLFQSAVRASPGFIASKCIKRQTDHRIVNCNKVYVWDKALLEFISLANATLPNANGTLFESMKDTTVRVYIDNTLPHTASDNSSHKIDGFLGNVWTTVQDALKFRSEIVSTIYLFAVFALYKGKVDVVLGPGAYIKEMPNVVFSQPYVFNWYNVFMKKPESKASSSSYLKIFDHQLWMYAILLFLLLTLLLWLSNKLLSSFYHVEINVSLASCFLASISGFLSQGFDIKVRTFTCRVQVFVAIIFGLLLYFSMNAILVSKITIYDTPLPFKTLDEIRKDGTYSMCIRVNSVLYINFTDESYNILPKWKGIINGPRCLDIQDSVNISKLLCKNKILIFENTVTMNWVLKNRTSCKIVTLPEKLYTSGTHFLMSLEFRYRRLVENVINKMRSSGVLSRLLGKWITSKNLVTQERNYSPEVTIYHISGLLIMYVIFILFSLIVLLVELLISKRKISKVPMKRFTQEQVAFLWQTYYKDWQIYSK